MSVNPLKSGRRIFLLTVSVLLVAPYRALCRFLIRRPLVYLTWRQDPTSTMVVNWMDNDSRSPKKVVFTSLEEDLKRRDFTINAMAMDTHPENFGKIYDPFNGQDDLSNGLLKTPLDPKKTFSDDPLRMMRAAYFSSKLNFKLDSDCRDQL